MSCSVSSTSTLTVLDKINIHLADQGGLAFNQVRYGMKSCRVDKDVYFMQDLRDLYITALELDGCDSELDDCTGCTLDTIVETINTL